MSIRPTVFTVSSGRELLFVPAIVGLRCTSRSTGNTGRQVLVRDLLNRDYLLGKLSIRYCKLTRSLLARLPDSI